MVRTLLDGYKTQTRRTVKLRSKTLIYDLDSAWTDGAANSQYLHVPCHHKNDTPGDSTSTRVSCPHGSIGDQLWVRETFNGPMWFGEDEPEDSRTPKYCHYAATEAGRPEYMDADDNLRQGWKPSIHMPRWASRITLEITGVRVERLQDISESDAEAEGIKSDYLDMFQPGDNPFAKWAYRELWESINGAGSWDANPWVWCVEFKRITP